MAEPTDDDGGAARERLLADVLWRFERAHPLPSGEDVERWGRDNPRFADEILEYAAVKARIFEAGDVGGDDVEDREADAEAAAAASDLMAVLAPGPGAPDLLALMDRAGVDLDPLAERLDLRVAVLERMVAGQVRGEVPTQVAYGLADALGAPVLEVVGAIRASASRPRPGHASATGEAGPLPTYDELILGSDMDEDRKAYWLRDD